MVLDPGSGFQATGKPEGITEWQQGPQQRQLSVMKVFRLFAKTFLFANNPIIQNNLQTYIFFHLVYP